MAGIPLLWVQVYPEIVVEREEADLERFVVQ